MDIIGRMAKTVVAALLGWCAGLLAGSIALSMPKKAADYPFLAETVYLPHHVPEAPDGVSFRFAMVHDVLHERFSRHGAAYDRDRVRTLRDRLRGLSPGDIASFALSDDLAVALNRVGLWDEAVAVIREKLAQQEAKGLSGRRLYTSYANLGTSLLYANEWHAASGDMAARERFREGIGFLHKAIEVNPQAHFGRERWQVAIAEFGLAAMSDPALLKKCDCLGNSLEEATHSILGSHQYSTKTGYGFPFSPGFSRSKADKEVPAFFDPQVNLDDPARWPEFAAIREFITKVGAESGWEAVAVPSHRSPVPFDGRMLGIVGMWRQGGGANPHFALALGETMLRVGQRYIAWSAYERASRLADRYSPDPATQQFLREHCRKRQADIETNLKAESHEVASLRPQFEAELAYGEGYQKSYQDFEEAKITSGNSIRAELFYHDFPRRSEAIASKSGIEEWFVGVPRAKMYYYVQEKRNAWAMLGAGLAAFLVAGLSRLRAGRRVSRHIERLSETGK